MTPAGGARIEALYRYPVKSMLGDEVDATAIGERGLVGDRAYALVDQETGKIASAKNPRRWSMLFECHAAFTTEPHDGAQVPPVRITFPDGTRVESDDATVHTKLSRAVGRAVRLESTPVAGAVLESLSPIVEGVEGADTETISDEIIAVVAPGTYFDAAPLHIVTTATLGQLCALAPESRFPASRFRPNVVVAVGNDAGFVENRWVNRTVTFGDVAASVFLAAPRCIMTTLAQPGLPRDPVVLQTIAQHNRLDIPGLGPRSCAGVYAIVTRPGTTRKGDTVEIA